MNRYPKSLMVLAAGLAISGTASADEFLFNTAEASAPATLNGVPVTATRTRDYTLFVVAGNLTLNHDDVLRIIGDRPAVIHALNDLRIEEGALIDAAANGQTPGPGGGAGGAGAGDQQPGAPGGAGGSGGAGGPWGSGGFGGTDGTDGYHGFNGTSGKTGGIPAPTAASSGSQGQSAYGGFGGGGSAGVTGAWSPPFAASGGWYGFGGDGGQGGSSGWKHGQMGEDGSDASYGQDGKPGTPGGRGGHGENLGAGFELSGGGGGGGGGAGTPGSGGGGGGGAGGGGGGGGGASTSLFAVGGQGGVGGAGMHGGSGGAGGEAGAGWTGGGGGGAVSILALGHAEMAGRITVAGGAATESVPPKKGAPGAFGSGGSFAEPGQSGTGGAGNGGHGGFQGAGGRGGRGGDGGRGGYGGGGAGGTIILAASVFAPATTGELNALSGMGGDETGHAGRVGLRDNITGHASPATILTPATTVHDSAPGVVDETPFGAPPQKPTPLIPGLSGGAEIYGFTHLTPADFAAVVAAAPAGAELALVRLPVGPAPLDYDFEGHDFIAVINLTPDPIADVAVEIGGGGGPLLARGTKLRAAGFGADSVRWMNPEAVWVTLADDSEQRFKLSTPMGAVETSSLRAGSAIYLAHATCYADCDGSGSLDFFDFLCFQDAFAAQKPEADCDSSGSLDFFDFLCFQNDFAAGCP